MTEKKIKESDKKESRPIISAEVRSFLEEQLRRSVRQVKSRPTPKILYNSNWTVAADLEDE